MAGDEDRSADFYYYVLGNERPSPEALRRAPVPPAGSADGVYDPKRDRFFVRDADHNLARYSESRKEWRLCDPKDEASRKAFSRKDKNKANLGESSRRGGSPSSQGSGESSTSAYSAVRVKPDDKHGYKVRASSQPVPPDLPTPPRGTQGVVDVERQVPTPYAVDSAAKRIYKWGIDAATGAPDWIRHHKGRLTKALVDATPQLGTIAAAGMAEGPGKLSTRITAAVGQYGLFIKDSHDQFKKFKKGDPNDPPKAAPIVAGFGRVIGASLDMADLASPNPAKAQASALITGASTMGQLAYDVATNPQPGQNEQFYQGMRAPHLGTGPGQIDPREVPSPTPSELDLSAMELNPLSREEYNYSGQGYDYSDYYQEQGRETVPYQTSSWGDVQYSEYPRNPVQGNTGAFSREGGGGSSSDEADRGRGKGKQPVYRDRTPSPSPEPNRRRR
ncbi:hypothetical protein GCM10009801_34140 [Streptomyces albiaxialis]|uniref:Uncharacterized protein n=1 Tax=Streptomyces albiaxialis TaxID=329523 RepID=A0ABN2VZC4_9ACTN